MPAAFTHGAESVTKRVLRLMHPDFWWSTHTLAKRVARAHNSVYRVLTELHRRGLVERTGGQNDRQWRRIKGVTNDDNK